MQQAENSTKSLRVNIILTVLDIDKQKLADQIGCDRSVVARVLSGERKTKRVQQKIVGALCQQIENLFVDPAQPNGQTKE